jgi:hypothetical protein
MRALIRFGAVLVGLTVAAIVLGQDAAPKLPPYNVKSEVVVRGKVTAVAAIPDWMGKDGVNVTLETPDSLLVHVDTAPADFLKMLDFSLANGDNLEITGVWGSWNGNRVFLARTLTRQKVMIAIRDPDGKPVW